MRPLKVNAGSAPASSNRFDDLDVPGADRVTEVLRFDRSVPRHEHVHNRKVAIEARDRQRIHAVAGTLLVDLRAVIPTANTSMSRLPTLAAFSSGNTF